MDFKKAHRLLLLSLAFYFICIVLFSFYKYKQSEKEKSSNVDNYIHSIAVSLPYYLDNNDISKLVNGKMTDAEYDNFVFTISNLSKIWNIDYIYQMRIVDGQIYNVFTSGNETELKNKTYQKYNEKYPNELPAMLAAYKELEVKYDSDSDDWGAFRSVYVPVLQRNGEYHILGVDYSLKQMEELLHKEAMASFIYGFLVLIFSFPFLFITYLSLQQIIVELDKNFKNLSDVTSQYRQLSLLDQTTQMPNRRSFIENAKREINRIKRSDGTLFIAIMDLDHFKRVNDTYGHNNGDITLISFSNLIQESLRLEDIWGRWGGEEFVVMFQAKDIFAAETILQRIRLSSEKNEIELSDGQKIIVTVSIGVVRVNITADLEVEKILTDAIDRADKQLYLAKETGRDRICYEKTNH